MEVEVLEYPTEKDWLNVKRRALITIGKTPIEPPDTEWKIKMLRCRHSPIRYLRFSFLLKDIPYWLHTELVRHHVGVQFFVRSQRDDRAQNEVPRAEKPQGALVNMIMDINAESLCILMNKRLCGCATKEMQSLMYDIRAKVLDTNIEFDEFLVPMCKYLHECKEFKSCGGKAVWFWRMANGE